MATPAEFEEKEYEGPLYSQLEEGTRLTWAPGQVFEKYIGIDRAIFLSNPDVWRTLRRKRRPGVLLEDCDLDYIWLKRHRRPLPDFKLNLFIQAKRCHYNKTLSRALKDGGLGSPSWHFNIDHEQQETLEKVARKLGRRAYICYAAPAFHTCMQLWGLTKAGTIIENSTFPAISKLTNHTRFYYDRPGARGKANPKIEDIDGQGLLEQLRTMRETVHQVEDASLDSLSENIQAALDDFSTPSPRKAIFFEEVRRIEFDLKDYEIFDGRSVRSFMIVSAFSKVFNLEWYVV